MLVLRQTRALVQLVLRFWLRRGVVGRRGSGAMRAPGIVVRVLLVFLFATIGRTQGELARGDARPLALFLLGIVLYVAAATGSATVVAARGIVSPLDARLLDSLPLHEPARVIARIAGGPQLFALCIAGVHAASSTPSIPRDLALGSLVAITSMVAGLALTHVVRALVAPMRVARMMVPLLVVAMSGFFLVAEASFISDVRGFAQVADVVWPLARGLVGMGPVHREVTGLFAVCVAASLAMGGAERAGFDRVDAVPLASYRRAASTDLSLARVDRVLAAREPGARFVWVGALYVAGCVALAWVARPMHLGTPLLSRGVLMLATFMGFSGASARAGRMAERDLVARPLLSPLPIVPGDLLAGKMAPIRTQAMVVVSPLLGLPFTAPRGEMVDVAWHVACTLLAVWIATGTLASIAFLTSGAGAGPKAAMSAPLSLERILVLVPMLAVAAAPSIWFAGVQLLALAFVAVEARRSAQGHIRWLDDQEDFARETSVWRALLVFAAFAAIMNLSGGLLASFGLSALDSTLAAYLVSAVALVALTAQERGGFGAIVLWPERRAFIAAGVACGLGVATLAAGYVHLVNRLGLDTEVNAEARSHAVAAVAFVMAAPIAEELFFRGWLLDAIAREYSARGQTFAILMSAFAFASVHPPLSFAPAILFGVVAAVLARRCGAIGPGVIAHAIVNAIALFVAR